MRVFQQIPADTFFKKGSGLDFRPYLRQVLVQFQNTLGLPAVQPGRAGAHKQSQSLRVGRIANLFPMEFQLVDGGVNEGPLDPVFHQIGEYRKDNLFNRVRILRPDIFEADVKHRVAVVRVKAGIVAQG